MRGENVKRFLGLVLVLGCAGPVLGQAQTGWTVKPEWVQAHEEFLASDAMGGRGSASRFEEIAANYVASELIGYGLQPAPGMTGYLQSVDVEVVTVNGRQRVRVAEKQGEPGARKTWNAIGWLPGSDPASGTILLTAHLDHLGTKDVPAGQDGIYNGANDDAAGTTAVLELAHALAAGPKLKRNVLFVCYGSEELGGVGSTYFGAHPPVPLDSLVANLEFEMIGNQDPKMSKGVLLLTGWERSNLGPTLKEHGALLGPDPYPEQHFFQRSDNYSLALKGVVAHTAAGWGTVPTYHQPNDDLAHLDLPFMTAAIQSLVEPMRWLASSDFKPKWNPGGRPKGRE
jgi:Zn-dependent M28 family amino/carboxypeptidase